MPDPQELVRDFRDWWGDAPSTGRNGRIFPTSHAQRVSARFVLDNPKWADAPRITMMFRIINELGWDRTDEILRWVTTSRKDPC